MPAGKPLKFKSVKVLQEKIDAFFDECDEKGEPYTITGLALALGTTRKLLVEYEHRDKYRNTIKAAKLRCENYAEKMLMSGKQAAGPIFALKNYGWVDKQEVEQTGALEISITRTIVK